MQRSLGRIGSARLVVGAECRVVCGLRVAVHPDRVRLLGDFVRPVGVVGETTAQDVSDEGSEPSAAGDDARIVGSAAVAGILPKGVSVEAVDVGTTNGLGIRKPRVVLT